MKDANGNDIIVKEIINADGSKVVITEKIDKNGNKIVIEEKTNKYGKSTRVILRYWKIIVINSENIFEDWKTNGCWCRWQISVRWNIIKCYSFNSFKLGYFKKEEVTFDDKGNRIVKNTKLLVDEHGNTYA